MNLHLIWAAGKRLWFEPGSPLPVCMFRILYGLVLLEYCFLIAPELITCFSDINGILRIKTLQNIFGLPVINLIAVMPPGDGWLLAFFAVFVVACLCLTMGLFTRISTVVVYLGLVSLGMCQ